PATPTASKDGTSPMCSRAGAATGEAPTSPCPPRGRTSRTKKLAAWLTAPEQQVVAFQAQGTFPSQVEALDSDEIMSSTNEFFNDAPVGEIYAERATAIEVQPFMGANFFVINTVVADAITRWDVDGQDPDESWEQAL